jgi:predicted TIM-barrel fold metal-dependent hydrolase
MLTAATKREQVKPANDWALSFASDGSQLKQPGLTIVPFGTYHPDDEEWLMEVDRLRAAGIKGLKLHPEFQGFDLADPRLHDFFAEVERDFILLIHVGDPVVSQDNYSTPRKIARILDDFPNIRIIAAHLGGFCF